MPRTALEGSMPKQQSALYLALELAKDHWRLAFSDGSTTVRVVSVPGGSVPHVVRETAKAKRKLGVSPGARVLSCYEAGRDGFWIHRSLTQIGFQNLVVDPSSIEVDRRRRRAKTDRLDADKLVRQLVRHDEFGDRMRVVHVPTPEQEDARRPERELASLKKERTRHRNRIRSLLALHGITAGTISRKFSELIPRLHHPAGERLPANVQAELRRESERLELVQAQMRQLEKERAARIKDKSGRAEQVTAKLMLLHGIAENTASVCSYEFFAWRQFKNRRQVGACAGMTGTPYDSGASSREQGISKAGNARVRAVIVQAAWGWLRYQPQSRLSLWYRQRFGSAGKRARRVGIVALGRKLLVALWRFVDQGLVPEGARVTA